MNELKYKSRDRTSHTKQRWKEKNEKNQSSRTVAHCKLLFCLTISPFSFYTVGWLAAKHRPEFLCVFCFLHCFDCWVSATELLCEMWREFSRGKANFSVAHCACLRLSRAFIFNLRWRVCKNIFPQRSPLSPFECFSFSSAFRRAIVRTENSVNFNVSLMIFPSKRFFRLCRFNEVLDIKKWFSSRPRSGLFKL